MATALGTSLRSLRNSAGLTIADVAGLAGVSISYLSRVENGLAKPRSSWVHNLVTAIGERIEDDERAKAAS